VQEDSQAKAKRGHVVEKLSLAEIGEFLRSLYLNYDSSLNENVSTVDAHLLAHEVNLASNLALDAQATTAVA
jgi:hypothetical protein